MTERKKKMFIHEYGKTLNIRKACEKIGIARKTYYKWLDDDEGFKNSVDEVKAYPLDEAEGALYSIVSELGEDGKPTRRALENARFLITNALKKKETIIEPVEIPPILGFAELYAKPNTFKTDQP
jgi:hypothetical protein